MFRVGQFAIPDTQGAENPLWMTFLVAAAISSSSIQSSFPEEIATARAAIKQVVEMVRPLPNPVVYTAPQNNR